MHLHIYKWMFFKFIVFDYQKGCLVYPLRGEGCVVRVVLRLGQRPVTVKLVR